MSTKHREGKKKRSKSNNKWFDRDCYIERKEVKSLLNAINRQPYNRDLQVKYFARRKEYNRTVKQTNKQSKKQQKKTTKKTNNKKKQQQKTNKQTNKQTKKNHQQQHPPLPKKKKKKETLQTETHK